MTRPRFALGFLLAVLATASTWFYMNRILRADQVADIEGRHRPRGNLSDLYPRWLGTRELLLHGRNPYSPEVTREIQQGYYGRPLDPTRPYDPIDQQAFAYPIYVAFLLAPTVNLPYEVVESGCRWLLIVLASASIFLWLRLLRWKASWGTTLIFAVLAPGWLPMVHGIKLQQPTLLVAALLAGCGCCLAGGWLFLGGGLLALATIKPQLAWPIVAWLFVWALSDWRARRRLVFGFALIMLLLLGGAELILPGWLPMFIAGIGQYQRYTQSHSALVLACGSVAGHLLELISLLACIFSIWKMRREPANSVDFGRAFSLVLALTAVIVPMTAPYNQVLMLPAILSLIWSEVSSGFSIKNPAIGTALPARLARRIGALLLVCPWIITLSLSVASFWLTPELRHRVSLAPFYTYFAFPIFVYGLALLEGRAPTAPLVDVRRVSG